MWDLSAAKIRDTARTLRPREGLARVHRGRPLDLAGLDRVDPGLPVRLGAPAVRRHGRRGVPRAWAGRPRWSAWPRTSRTSASTTTGSTTSAPTATSCASPREGRIDAEPWERRFYELALKVSGAVQARRWTSTADGGGFIHSFNGPHSLFVDTIRSLRSLAVAHRLGHVLMEENDARVSLLARLVEHARDHGPVLGVLREGPRLVGRARPGGPRVDLQRRRRPLPVPELAAGLLAVLDMDPGSRVDHHGIRRAARVPRHRGRRGARGPRRPGGHRGLHERGRAGHCGLLDREHGARRHPLLGHGRPGARAARRLAVAARPTRSTRTSPSTAPPRPSPARA